MTETNTEPTMIKTLVTISEASEPLTKSSLISGLDIIGIHNAGIFFIDISIKLKQNQLN